MYAKEHIDDDSVFVVERFYVDYSAQNGFGGMNREWCSCDVSISYSDYSVTFSRKFETDDYTLRQDIAEATYVKTLFWQIMKYDRKVQSYDILQYKSEASYVKTIF